MKARPAPRANHEGYPCPPWCVTDHDEVRGIAEPLVFHGSALAAIRPRGDSVCARAIHDGTRHGKPAVLVTGLDRAAEPELWVQHAVPRITRRGGSGDR